MLIMCGELVGGILGYYTRDSTIHQLTTYDYLYLRYQRTKDVMRRDESHIIKRVMTMNVDI
jgi:hypothetical protein